MAKSKVLKFEDWLVIRLWGRVSEGAELCVLTTRGGHILARHYRLHLRSGLYYEGTGTQGKRKNKKVPGLRRYKTEKMAAAKAEYLNRIFKTEGYSAIMEGDI